MAACPLLYRTCVALAGTMWPTPTSFCRCAPPICAWPESRAVSQAWQCVSCPKQSQYHSKVTPAPGRGEGNHTHQSDCKLNSGLGADSRSDRRPHPSTKPSQGHALPFGAASISGKWLAWHDSSPRWPPDWPTKDTGAKPRPPQAERKTAARPTTVGRAQHAQETPWKGQLLAAFPPEGRYRARRAGRYRASPS